MVSGTALFGRTSLIVDPDLIFVVGLVAGLLSVPAFLSAYSESRSPRAGLILIVLCAAMIAFALVRSPAGTYTMENIPTIITELVGKILN